MEALITEIINCGLLSDKEKIRHWCNRLGDKSDQDLIEGIRKMKDCQGPLSLGRLREICVYIAPLKDRIYQPDRQLTHGEYYGKERQRRFRENREKNLDI